jgi:chromosome segregation ATPase
VSRAAEIDPELVQAVVDLQRSYAEYVRFKSQMRELSSPLQYRQRAAACEAMNSAWADIRLRAERIRVKASVLGELLRVSAEEFARLRRRPNKGQMDKAIRASIEDLKEQCRAKRIAIDKAQRELSAMESRDHALRKACLAFTGYAA